MFEPTDMEDLAWDRYHAMVRREARYPMYPGRAQRAEDNAGLELAFEWSLSSQRADEEALAVAMAQLADYATAKERLAAMRIALDDLRAEREALRDEIGRLRAEIAQLSCAGGVR